MSELQRPGSISSSSARHSEEGSPFNGVKMGLVIFLLGAVPLWWAVDHLLRSPLAQLAVAGGYGLAGMAWVMLRTRRILRERPPGDLDAVRDGESGGLSPSSGPFGPLSPKGGRKVGAASGRSLSSPGDGAE